MDHFIRTGGGKTKDSIVRAEDFFAITRLIQDLILLRNNLASENFRREIEANIIDQFGNEYSRCENFVTELVEWQIENMSFVNIDRKNRNL